jgi:hypothetical protein
MNNKAILLATMAFLAVSSFLMIGEIGIQTAEAEVPVTEIKKMSIVVVV